MAITKCKECGESISDKAETCPHCGAPLKKTGHGGRQNYGCGTLLLVIVIGGVFFSIIGNDLSPSSTNGNTDSASYESNDNQSTGQSDGNGSSGSFDTITQYAHKTINVRAGPGTDHEVVGQLKRGDSVEIAFTEGDWREITSGEYKGKFVYSPLLKAHPVPDIEIASWNWRSDPTFGSDGAVIWTVEVRNNTSRYIEAVRLKFTTYDKQGNIIDTDTGYASGLSPGGTSSTKGYATYYGREEKGRIQVTGKR